MIQTEGENEHSFSKDRDSAKTQIQKKREDGAGQSPRVSNTPFPPWEDLNMDSVRSERNHDMQRPAVGFNSQGGWRDKNPGPSLAGLVSRFTKGQIPHLFFY